MRAAIAIPYWVFVGVLTIAGIYLSVLYNLPPYFFWAALVLALLGAWWPGPRYSWAALIGFGGLPALFLSANLLGEVGRADWSCSEISFRPGGSSGYGGPLGAERWCTTIPGQLVVTTAVFLAVTLLGVVALSFLLRGSRTGSGSRRSRWGVVGIGVVLLASIGGISFRAADDAVPPPPEVRAGLPPNGLPVSCSTGEDRGAPDGAAPDARDPGEGVVLGTEDVGVFNGVGDGTSPSFETYGEGWRYAFASTGTGSFTIEALDEDGNPVPSSTITGAAGEGGESPLLADSGTYRIKIRADEEVGHTVRVCIKNPYVRNVGPPNR